MPYNQRKRVAASPRPIPEVPLGVGFRTEPLKGFPLEEARLIKYGERPMGTIVFHTLRSRGYEGRPAPGLAVVHVYGREELELPGPNEDEAVNDYLKTLFDQLHAEGPVSAASVEDPIRLNIFLEGTQTEIGRVLVGRIELKWGQVIDSFDSGSPLLIRGVPYTVHTDEVPEREAERGRRSYRMVRVELSQDHLLVPPSYREG